MPNSSRASGERRLEGGIGFDDQELAALLGRQLADDARLVAGSDDAVGDDAL
ncbi:MAG TPA: hypothetical protein VFV02_03100 [Acidimicrobiales bacterium]|nr:hypothetical protein [Acidimicrobiales bacterium]